MTASSAAAAPEKPAHVVRLSAAPAGAASWTATWPDGGAPVLRLCGAPALGTSERLCELVLVVR